MKSHFGLKVAPVIGLMLCSAIALRILAANTESTKAQFQVKISPPAQTNCKDFDEFKEKLKTSGALVETSVCLDWNDDNGLKTWCPKGKKRVEKSAPKQSFSPPPHVQQTLEFTNPAGLKALSDALAPTMSPSTMTPPAMRPGASPPPHIQQTAGLDSTQRDKLIAEALQR